jgi:sugar lactone lactonase YvrE
VYFASGALCQVFKLGPSGQLFLVAGNGGHGFSGDGGAATAAELYGPAAVAVDGSGNLFIADYLNNRIRRVDASTQVITTVAGNGTAGFTGDGGPATSAAFYWPYGVTVDSSGNLFISDTANNRIRRVDAATQIITTVAGDGSGGYNGDGGPATSAELNWPTAVTVDGSGNLLVADSLNERIRRVDAASQIITTVAGNGTQGFSGDSGPATSAELSWPYDVAVDTYGDLFIADLANQRIRRVDAATQVITTVAGNGTLGFSGDGGPATTAELSSPNGVALDRSGNVFISDAGNNRIRRVDAATTTIATIAGGGTGGDNGPATAGVLNGPYGVAVDIAGDLFIGDYYNYRIRRVDAATQIITTVAGNGMQGPGGDGGPATSAEIAGPFGVAVDASGNLFFTDICSIRRVDAASQIIATVAGQSYCGFSGDGGPATNAELGGAIGASGVAVDVSGNLFIDDTGNYRIRRVDEATQIITTVAGNGSWGFSGDGGPATSAQFAGGTGPSGVAVGSSGNLFIADNANFRIRRVDARTQIITTVAGSGASGFGGDGGAATAAQLNYPSGAAVDSSGNLFIADLWNNRIRRVDAVSQIITTVAGNGTPGFSGDGGPATAAQLNYPSGVAVDSSGNLFIGDASNNRIRKVALPPFEAVVPTSLTFGNQSLGTTSPAQPLRLTNTGLIPLEISTITASEGFAENDTCAGTIEPQAGCTINVTFAPTAPGTQTGTITITDNAFGSPQTVSLGGTGVGPVVSLPAPPTFPSEPVGTTSPAQTVTLTNTGNANLTFTAIGASGPFAIAASGTTCSTTSPVAASGSCTVAITFTPTAAGAASGTLSFTDNAGGSPQTLPLSATGQDFSLAVPTGSSSSATVSPGGTATYTITATAIGGFNQAVNLACSGAPSEASCQLSPSPVTPSSSGTNITVTVTTTAPSFSAPRSRHLPPARPLAPWPRNLMVLALLLTGAAWAVRNWGHPGLSRLRTALVALALAMLLTLAMAACGGGGSSAPSNPGTPPGTYTITVTGSFGSGSSPLTHSVKLTLTVS